MSDWPDLFELQRVRRFGTANPQRMRFALLEWMIRRYEPDASSQPRQEGDTSFRNWAARHGHEPCAMHELGPTDPGFKSQDSIYSDLP